ncbi:MAG: Flp pilus assembly protein CpaB [Firmicutes bacterium]|nr:Flp pilus assembly protein CpaB [Bacillota bacterium]
MVETRRRAALAFLLAAVLASAAAWLFMQEVLRHQAALGRELPVLVAARPLPAWQPIGPGDLASQPVASRYLLPGLLTDPGAAVGKVPVAPLAPGEPVLAGLLRAPEEVPPDLRVVTLAAGERVVVEPGIAPGDRVDVVASYERDGVQVTEVYLVDVPVLDRVEEGTEVRVSLQLSLESARRLIHVENYGRQVRLLRRPRRKGGGMG